MLEPLAFTSVFHGWDPTPQHTDFFANLQELNVLLQEYNRIFSYQDLVEGNYPKGLDTAQLENYISDQEFENVFETTRKEFAEMPKWKQQQIKREKGLY